jgi:hypothetical protein
MCYDMCELQLLLGPIGSTTAFNYSFVPQLSIFGRSSTFLRMWVLPSRADFSIAVHHAWFSQMVSRCVSIPGDVIPSVPTTTGTTLINVCGKIKLYCYGCSKVCIT